MLRGAGKALAALFKQAPRLGAPLLKRGGDDRNRRLPKGVIVGDFAAQCRYFGVEARALLLRLGGAAGRRERAGGEL